MYIERIKETLLPFCKKVLPKYAQHSTEAIHVWLNYTQFFSIGLGFP